MIPLSGRCFVVGNSGSVLQNKIGSIIDSCDEILRFNHAPTEGFDECVGSKTTSRIINLNYIQALCDKKMDNNLKLHFSSYNKEFYKSWRGEKIGIYAQKSDINKYVDAIDLLRSQNDVYILDWDYALEIGKKCPPKPSCGILGLQIACENCDSISCAGFNFYDGPWNQYHYFEKVKRHTEHGHSFSDEKKYFNELVNKYDITVY